MSKAGLLGDTRRTNEREGRKEGKNEIIVEMSEMCLRASFADLPTDIVVRGEENGYSCRSLSSRDRRFCSHANYPQQCAARSA